MSCDHKNSLGESAIISHKMISGETWHRCLRCMDTWHSEDKMKPALGAYKAKPIGTKGEVTRLPKVNSPMWTTQYSVVVSEACTYIVSQIAAAPYDGNVTGDGWACSCMAFTRNMPREDCKHILKVKLFESMSTAAKTSPVHDKEYAEFLKLKAKEKRAAAVDGEVKMVGDATSRKFR